LEVIRNDEDNESNKESKDESIEATEVDEESINDKTAVKTKIGKILDAVSIEAHLV
jgi:hypothetical protein